MRLDTYKGMTASKLATTILRVAEVALMPEEYQLFRLVFLMGADRDLCCRFLGMGLLTFDQRVAAIESKLAAVLP
jgi:predicted DNA-binding protein (UPF0251 family)